MRTKKICRLAAVYPKSCRALTRIFLPPYPAVFTLLYSYFSSRLLCCAYPRSALIFLSTYPAVFLIFYSFNYPALPLFYFHLTTLLSAMPLFLFCYALTLRACDGHMWQAALASRHHYVPAGIRRMWVDRRLRMRILKGRVLGLRADFEF